jgi:hypothetical protein
MRRMCMSKRPRFEFALAASISWVAVPVAWGIATLLAEDGAGDSLSVLGVTGWVALGTAGLLMLLAIRGFEPSPRRRRVFQAGIAVHALGVLAAVVVFWAVPFWAALYAVAMVLYAISMRGIRRAALVTALAMVTGIAALVVLTALEVGTPDPVYGDYPIAWTTAYTVASLGGAVGSILLYRSSHVAPGRVIATG